MSRAKSEMHATSTVGGALLGAWAFMIGIGDWHAQTSSVPTIGYWPACLIMIGVGCATDATIRYTRTTR